MGCGDTLARLARPHHIVVVSDYYFVLLPFRQKRALLFFVSLLVVSFEMDSADHKAAPAAKKARTEAPERQEPRRVVLAGVAVNAVGMGTLPVGVSYPEPHSRPTAKVFHEMLHAAAAACGPHRLVVDTADTCA